MTSFATKGATWLLVLLLAASFARATPAPLTLPEKVGDEFIIDVYTAAGNEAEEGPIPKRRPDGKWVVVWPHKGDGSGFGVYMQLYNADRTAFGGQIQVHTNTANDQKAHSVAVAADNTFVIAWHSSHTGVVQVQSQRFAADGSKIGAEITVHTNVAAPPFGSDVGEHTAVAVLTNGDVVYCWRTFANSPDVPTIMIRRYDANLSPLDSATQVNTDSPQYPQSRASVAALTDGGFVVVFNVYGATVDDFKLLGQLYAADGAKVGAVFQISQLPTHTQCRFDVAALPNGGFIVTWHAEDPQFSYDVMHRHFAANGVALANEAVANLFRDGYQCYPTVATFGDNSYAIAWLGFAPGSTDYDIGMQMFDASDNKVGTEVVANTQRHYEMHPRIGVNWNDKDFGMFFVSRDFSSATLNSKVIGQWYSYSSATSPSPTPLPATPAPPTPTPPTPTPPTPTPSTPVPLPTTPSCVSACLRYVCPEGSLIDVRVTGVVANDVFGSDFFTDDSNVAAAAVFAGVVAVGETATVTVKCSGPKPSFASGSANGVTTQEFASAWPSSFTFDLAGETQAPAPPSPPRCYHEPCVHGKCLVAGTSFDIIVEGVLSDQIWGSDAFSEDSWLGAAAVHQGLLQAGAVGSVKVGCSGPRGSLTGSTRNGVTSNSFGSWPYTYVLLGEGPTPAPAPENICPGACLQYHCPENGELFLRVYGSTTGYLWGGSAPYTTDSTVSAAAVHAGLVAADSLGIVKATCTGSQTAFTGSSQHGVTSSSYGAHPTSFTLSAGIDMPTVQCDPAVACIDLECVVIGRVIKLNVTGSTISNTLFWGHILYSEDSPVSHAAVHAGLIADGESKVLYATCQGPKDYFIGSTENGVTSTEYTTFWPGSFTLSPVL